MKQITAYQAANGQIFSDEVSAAHAELAGALAPLVPHDCQNAARNAQALANVLLAHGVVAVAAGAVAPHPATVASATPVTAPTGAAVAAPAATPAPHA